MEAIQFKNISKSFNNIKALDNISFNINYNEIHAILGENGAGKTTLMSVLFGLKTKDSGSILIDGKPVEIKTPKDAEKLGIGMVHQHFELINNFTVLENIILGSETEKFGFIDKKAARSSIMNIILKYSIAVPLDKKVRDLTIAQQQKVEILKLLYRKAKIIILDEPTAVLSQGEIDNLFKILNEFKAEGRAIILISHKLGEVKQYADKTTIMRLGQVVSTVKTADYSEEDLAEMMVGHKVNIIIHPKEVAIGKTVLSVNNLTLQDNKKTVLKNFSIDVHSKEIVGIAALDGSGQDELFNYLGGYSNYKKLSGDVKVPTSIGFIPADRQNQGLILDYSIADNLIAKDLKHQEKYGFLNKKKIKVDADKLMTKYDIRADGDSSTIVRNLSGGNQQKVIIARELEMKPQLLLSNDATRGLDAGAIETVNNNLIRARDNGAAILLYSSEITDLLNVASKIIVLSEGKIIATVNAKEANAEEIGYLIGGIKKTKSAVKFKETHNSSADNIAAASLNLKQKTFKKDRIPFESFWNSIISIVLGLLVGFIFMLIINPTEAGYGLFLLLSSGFDPSSYPQLLQTLSPLILLGLAFAISSRAGIFNIGLSGQAMMGGVFVVLLSNIIVDTSSPAWFILSLLLAIICGAIWGIIPIIIKNYFHVNEVITCIMLNWVAAYFTAFLANLPIVTNFNHTRMNYSNLNGLGVPAMTDDFTIAIIFSLIIVVLVFVLFNYTSFGFKNKAIGFSKTASKYMHFNVNNNYLVSMAISGGLAGLAGLFIFAAVSNSSTLLSFSTTPSVIEIGFDGIAVALLGNNDPFGILLAALFVIILQIGGGQLG